MKIGYSIFHTGVQISLERFGFSFGVSLLIVSGSELIGSLASKLYVHKLPKKISMVAFVVFSCGIGFCFLLDVVEESKILQTAIAGITRFTCYHAYIMLVLMMTETFDRSV